MKTCFAKQKKCLKYNTYKKNSQFVAGLCRTLHQSGLLPFLPPDGKTLPSIFYRVHCTFHKWLLLQNVQCTLHTAPMVNSTVVHTINCTAHWPAGSPWLVHRDTWSRLIQGFVLQCSTTQFLIGQCIATESQCRISRPLPKSARSVEWALIGRPVRVSHWSLAWVSWFRNLT